MDKLETLANSAKNTLKIVGTLGFLAGLNYGLMTFPYDVDPAKGTYSRTCAAFRTDEVRKIALQEQTELFNDIYTSLK